MGSEIKERKVKLIRVKYKTKPDNAWHTANQKETKCYVG